MDPGSPLASLLQQALRVQGGTVGGRDEEKYGKTFSFRAQLGKRGKGSWSKMND